LGVSGTEADQLAAAAWLRRVFYVPTAAWKRSIVTRGVRLFRQALDHLSLAHA
jgi:hypothetical protein